MGQGKQVIRQIDIGRVLANLPLFQQLRESELTNLAAGTREVGLTKGQILFQKGTLLDGFYVVVHGQIKLAFSSPQGHEKVVSIVGPGQSFGEAVMFMKRPHVVTAQALADSLLLFVEREAVFEEIKRDPDFAARMIAGLSRRLHHLVGDLEAYSMRSGTERVIGYLLSTGADGVPASGACDITLPTTKGVVASRLNLTQEHFSRILHDLTTAGLIKVRGRTVHILDVERLRGHST